MADEKTHRSHALGSPSSKNIPVMGVEPSQIHCPFCEKTFKTQSEMERHKDTMHHEKKGHQ